MSVWPRHTDDALRRMYAGTRGNETARRYARFWSTVFSLGIAPRRWVTLEVAGRSSGRPTRFPLGMATRGDRSFLVSMLGEDCNWAKNVRAADGVVIIRHRRARPCRLVDVDEAQRAPLIKLYLDQVRGARPAHPYRPLGRPRGVRGDRSDDAGLRGHRAFYRMRST